MGGKNKQGSSTANYSSASSTASIYGGGGSWIQVQRLHDQLDNVPDESFALILNAMFSHLRKPIPFELSGPLKRPITLKDGGNNTRRLGVWSLSRDSMNAYMAIRHISTVPLHKLVKKLSSGKTRPPRVDLTRVALDCWPQARLWIAHLRKYVYNILYPEDDFQDGTTSLSAQMAILAIAGFVQAISKLEGAKDVVLKDASMLDIVHSLWMKLDMDVADSLEMKGITYASTEVLVQIFEERESGRDVSILSGYEKATVKIATSRLRRAMKIASEFEMTSFSTDPWLSVAVFSCQDLLSNLMESESFAPYVFCPSTVKAFIGVLRYCNERDYDDMDPGLWFATLGALDSLQTLFSSENGLGCVVTALKDRLLVILANLTDIIDDEGSVPFPDAIGDIFKHFARYSTNRRVVKLLVHGFDYIYKAGLAVYDNPYVGDLWKRLREVTIERYICMHWSDVSFDRKEAACMTCERKGLIRLLKRCAGCKTAVYCSRECQILNWTEGKHRLDCVIFAEKKRTGKLLELPTSHDRETYFQRNLAKADIRRHWGHILSELRRITTEPTSTDPFNNVRIHLDYSDYSFRPEVTILRTVRSGDGDVNRSIQRKCVIVRVDLAEGHKKDVLFVELDDPLDKGSELSNRSNNVGFWAPRPPLVRFPLHPPGEVHMRAELNEIDAAVNALRKAEEYLRRQCEEHPIREFVEIATRKIMEMMDERGQNFIELWDH